MCLKVKGGGVLSLTNEKLNLKANKNPTYLRLDACGHLHTLAAVEKILLQDWFSGLLDIVLGI